MESRQLFLNTKSQTNGECVIYVVSRDIRVRDNHGLVIAQKSAIKSKLPLLVIFNLLSSSGFRSKEHYEFLLKGLDSFNRSCEESNFTFIMIQASDSNDLVDEIKKFHPKEVIFDFNPLRGPRKLQNNFAKNISCRVSLVDNHNIIPAWVASDKEEFAAYTFRPKIYKHLEKWLIEPEQAVVHPYSSNIEGNFKLTNALVHTRHLKSSGINIGINAGEQAAHEQLNEFINNNLTSYSLNRNNPELQAQSNLSPYLHYGFISSLRIALEIISIVDDPSSLFGRNKVTEENGYSDIMVSAASFLEELIVRKELSENYCLYNHNYDNFNGAKPWARESLDDHKKDQKEFVYTTDELENSKTHDPAWNAAQNQMTTVGKMHGYMRMYWAKKILEWSQSPEEAIKTAIYLNDKYSIDGGDPNGYTGIMWSICGIHDRPWFERPVFGKIRYMNYAGLKRKFNVQKYEDEWNILKLDF